MSRRGPWPALALAALAILTALLGGPARAASIRAGPVAAVMPGDVAAVPLEIQGSGTIEVTPEAGLTALGATAPEGGHALATLLAAPSARAGPHTVHVRLVRGGATVAGTTVTVVVATVVKASLRGTAPPAGVVAGTPFSTTLTLVNRSNAPETFSVHVSSGDPALVTPAHLRLAPGAAGKLELEITPQSFGQRIAILTASALGTSYKQDLVVDYDALAFPGASPGAPVLDVHVPFSVSYGTGGFAARAGAGLAGKLSDFVATDSGMAYRYPSAFGAHASLIGSDWSVAYRYGSFLGQDLTGNVRGFSGTVAMTPSGSLETGVGYTAGAFGVSYTHSWSSPSSDALSLSYGVHLAPWLELRGELGATGESLAAGYVVGPLVGARLEWAGLGLLGDVGGLYTPRGPQPWRATMDLYSQELQPVGFGSSATVTPTGSSGTLSVYETLGPAVVASQHASYAATGSRLDGRGRFGVLYALPGQLGSVRASLRGRLQRGSIRLSGSLLSVVTPLPWVTTVGVSENQGWSASADETYVGNGFSLGAGASAPLTTPFQPTISAHGSVQLAPLTASLALHDPTASGRLYGEAQLSVPLTHAFALQGTVGVDEAHAVTYRVGLTANLLTGLHVPRSVVSAFGGRDAGTVRGRVVRRTATGARGIPGVLVVAAADGRQARTDRKGSFVLQLPPGATALQLADLPLDLTVVGSPKVTVALHRTTTVTIVVERTYAISGQAFLTKAGSDRPTSASRPLPFVSVRLSGPRGERRTVTTDASGNFLFGGLTPGHYLVRLVQASLPAADRSTGGPQAVELGPSHSSATLDLGAAHVKADVSNTLSTGSLALQAHSSLSTAPPGADITVTAVAPGASAVSASWPGGAATALRPLGAGRFAGTLTVPGPAGGGAPAAGADVLEVTARAGKQRVTQDLTVVVVPGPLATLTLAPGFAAPGQSVSVTAHLLVKSSHVVLRLGTASTALERKGDGTYAGTLSAPARPGTYDLALFVDGKRLAEARLAVTGSAR